MEKIVNRTHQILKDNGIFAKKKFGQNFLISEHVLEETINKSGVNKDSYVIEIGTGLGTLTEYLAINAKKVLSYEIDPDMYNISTNNLNIYDNIHIKLEDFMDSDIDKDIYEYLDNTNEVIVIANIPYYITTPIAFKLLENSKVKKIFLMMQAELAERFKATPKTKEYSSLSALVSYRGVAKKELSVSRNCFYPVPGVDSILLSVSVIKRDYGLNNEPDFLKYLRDIFSLKRKTITNNLEATRGLKKDIVGETLENMGLSPSSRAEELDIEKLVSLYKELFERK